VKKDDSSGIGLVEVIEVRNCQGIRTRYFRWISHEELPTPGVYRVLLIMKERNDSLYIRQHQVMEV
jgi:hypothetical protein